MKLCAMAHAYNPVTEDAEEGLKSHWKSAWTTQQDPASKRNKTKLNL